MTSCRQFFGSAKAVGAAVSGTVSAATAAVTGGTTAAKPMTREQVEAMIEKLADESGQDYNWDESIVDLMKLLKLDSNLTARNNR